MNELYQQQKDSDMIFKQISTSAAIDNYKDAERLILSLYIGDMTISRAGISDALKRLDKFYKSEKGR